MPRNKAFHSQSHEPLRAHKSLELQNDRITGPFSFSNPTRALFKHTLPKKSNLGYPTGSPVSVDDEQLPEENALRQKDEQQASNIEFMWRSRDNRKGRHALVMDPSSDPSSKYLVPQKTTVARAVLQGVLRMITQYPYWDVSWLVAVIFTLGSVVWVINAFFSYLPLVQPGTEFHNEALVGGGVSAFIGATIFEIGSVLLIIEAMNDNKSGCFGWALEQVLAGDEKGGYKVRVRPDEDRCVHHQTNKGNFVGKGSITEPSKTNVAKSPDSLTGVVADETDPGQSFVWWPSMHELKSHYLRELGFLAALAQLCGATIFWISGFTALPGINNKMSQGLLDGVFWVPQVVGGCGFIISGSLYMLETQPKWYIPGWEVLGWHIGFWNLIGAFGFTLCGALGPASGNSGAEYEASLATFWGSWAFLIGSTIQWYESLDKHPVETMDPSMKHKASTP